MNFKSNGIKLFLFLTFFSINCEYVNSKSSDSGLTDSEIFQDDRLKPGCKNRDFEQNSAIPYSIKKEMRPFIIGDNHPMKSRLDKIFFKSRAILDEESFIQAGFVPISIRHCTHVYVSKHSLLPGYLVKAYLDTEKRKKKNQESWKWLVKRCQGARDIQKVIKKKKIVHFTVARKWIYPFPSKPLPPDDAEHTRHFALLLVTDMDLVDPEYNLYAWQHLITKEHLDELFFIISHAKGSSYRPDNISYTKQGNFAFVDTEYPQKGPDFKSIRPYLNPEMLAYWDDLVSATEK